MKTPPLRVFFAPDWRLGVGYQHFLAGSLGEINVSVNFLSNYRRYLPLWRGMRTEKVDVLHLHWPEAYYQGYHSWQNWAREHRYPWDLRLAARSVKALAVTAHNLWPHNVAISPQMRTNLQVTYDLADAIFAHSDSAAAEVEKTFPSARGKITIIPIGDLSPTLPPPPSRADALRRLGLSDEPFCVFFGVIAPYKGLLELLEIWPPEVTLHIVGFPSDESTAKSLQHAAAKRSHVVLHLEKRATDEELACWLAAAGACVFAYRNVLTSGAAALARSRGIPILLPKRITNLDLRESESSVVRFDETHDDLSLAVQKALSLPNHYENGAEFRTFCSWQRIAETTRLVYEKILTVNHLL